MFWPERPITEQVSREMFFTNHMRVLTLVAQNTDVRLRQIASEVGITERAAHRIVSELVEAGYLARERKGARNRYAVLRSPPVDPRAAELMLRPIAEEPAANGKRPDAPDADRFHAVRDAVPGGVVVADQSGKVRRQDRELAEAEERFRSAFDNAPIGMALVGPDGRWLKVNRAICEITGYSETALLTRTFQSITHPDDLDADLAYVRRMLAGEIRSYQMDKRYYHADGHIIWVSLSVSLVRDAGGEPLYFISQVKDITHRRAAEESQRLVVDRIAEAVSIIDVDGTHLHVNQASRAILEDLRQSFDEGPIPDLAWGAIAEDGTPLTAAQLPAEITRLTGEEIDDAVVGFPSASETVRWLRISTRRLSDGPPPYQVIASFTDVTRRKQAERALMLSEARLNALFRYIPAALSLRDLDGRYLHVTDSVARALGRTPEDMVGRHPAEHLSGEILEQTLADDEAIRATGETISREVSIKHADGSDHKYYVLKWPVLEVDGKVAALGAFSLDISDYRQLAQRAEEGCRLS